MVDLISREAALAIIDPGDGDFHAGNYNGIAALPTVTGYPLTSDAEAMVAAALRGATRVAVEAAIDYWEETEKPVEQRKHGGKGLPACVAAEIEGLIPQPASAALDKLIAEAVAAATPTMQRAALVLHDEAMAAAYLGENVTEDEAAMLQFIDALGGKTKVINALHALATATKGATP
jgi:hypothetical protein